jgi:hypothetical protein
VCANYAGKKTLPAGHYLPNYTTTLKFVKKLLRKTTFAVLQILARYALRTPAKHKNARLNLKQNVF